MLIQSGISFGEYLNADDVARDLVGPPKLIAAKAQQIVRDQRIAALAAGRDHAFETVMSHPSHIEYMRAAAVAGFTVRLFFVATEDPLINVGRVASRVSRGGHDVPKDRIVARYRRCLDNLPDAISASHICDIYDNSSADDPLRRICQISGIEGSTCNLRENMANHYKFRRTNTRVNWCREALAPHNTFLGRHL